MKIHQYMQGRAVRYFKPVIFDDGNKVILSGGGLRIFDCQKEKFVQTISRLCNAISGLSYSESKLFVINATSKGSVICIIYERIGETFCEMQRQTIKGVNTDGGGPYFSSDEKYVFFARSREECGAIRLKIKRVHASMSENILTSLFSGCVCRSASDYTENVWKRRPLRN